MQLGRSTAPVSPLALRYMTGQQLSISGVSTSLHARGLEPVPCVIYFAPVLPRCLHRGALCGGCDSLLKGQAHISRARGGPRWINSSAFLFQLHKFTRRRDSVIEFHCACTAKCPQRQVLRVMHCCLQMGMAPTLSCGTAALA